MSDEFDDFDSMFDNMRDARGDSASTTPPPTPKQTGSKSKPPTRKQTGTTQTSRGSASKNSKEIDALKKEILALKEQLKEMDQELTLLGESPPQGLSKEQKAAVKVLHDDVVNRYQGKKISKWMGLALGIAKGVFSDE